MVNKQYELCVEVLRRMQRAGVLKYVILIGSWCIPFYKGYFSGVKFIPSIKTRDMDFLIPDPPRIKAKIDLPNLLKDLGFVVGFKGPEGYVKLEHPQLVIEFLVPEKGRATRKPIPLPQLGLNAEALRFLELLNRNTIKTDVEGVIVPLPHPVNFALHKLILLQRRSDPEKTLKDKEAALKILKALVAKGESETIIAVLNTLPQKWQKRILEGLQGAEEREMLRLLSKGSRSPLSRRL